IRVRGSGLRFLSAALREILPVGRHSRHSFGHYFDTRSAGSSLFPHPLLAALVGALTASLRSLPLRSSTGAPGGPAAVPADSAHSTAAYASLRCGCCELSNDFELAPLPLRQGHRNGTGAISEVT